MANVSYPTLVTTRYVVPGAYISQLIVPSAAVAPDTRLPCYVGAGSRFAVARNRTIRRAFLYDQKLSFPPNAPFVAALPHVAVNDKTLARLVKDGTSEEVKFTQWNFVNVADLTNTTGPFNGVLVSPEVYDPTAVYKVSYQSNDRTVVDAFPVNDIREYIAVGDSPDVAQYTEYVDFFSDYSVTGGVLGDALALKPAATNTNQTPSFSAVTNTSVTGGLATVSGTYAHSYNRFYTIRCTIGVPGTTPTRTATFEWSAQPVSAGNDNLPPTPLDPAHKPTFVFNETIGSDVSTTRTFELELGISVVIDITAGNFAAGDVITFNARGPARIEIDARMANTNQYVEAGSIAKTAGTGYASVAYATTSNPSTTWNAKYRVQCTAASKGISTAATHSFTTGGGTLAVSAKIEGAAGNAITVTLADPAATNRPLTVSQSGTVVTVSLATDNAGVLVSQVGDIATAINNASGLSVIAVASGTTTAIAAAASASLSTGLDGVWTATLAWAEYGERVGVGGSQALTYDLATPLILPGNVTLSNGVVLTTTMSKSVGRFLVGDTFEFEVKAPREFYKAKDNRTVHITTDSIVDPGTVNISYVTDTLEGAFGNAVASDNALDPSASGWLHGAFTLPGNLLLAARNLHGGPTPATSGNRHAATNKFTFTATLAGTIDWSLVSTTTETISKAQILSDVVGSITGTPATPYIILSNVPDSVVSVTANSTPVSYSLLTNPDGSNTQYIAFVTKPAYDVVVQYIYRGAEPAPGQIYYMSTKHVRPSALFNTPILVTSLEDGRQLLAPAEATNHLYIMNEIAMGDNGAPGMYIVQVKDADGDGFYTDLDYKDAITASEAPKAITDLVVLSHWASLSDQLKSLDRMADPFKRRFRMGWFGAGSGTLVGSENDPHSLIYYARRTLQVTGNNPAHGTRVLVAPTEAKRDLRLDNGTVTEVTLDGSFVAGALAAMVAAFADPADTVLRKNLAGFKSIETHGDVESPTNLQLGASNVVFFTDQGASVYRVEEDVTVDTFAADFNLINNMVQKMYVNKTVRDQLDLKVVGMVVPSADAGVTLIKGFLVQTLLGLLGRGLIGRYQNDDGSERSFDPSKDVVVFRDPTDPTLYHVLYAFYLRNTIKRVFGLYSVNTNDFGAGR